MEHDGYLYNNNGTKNGIKYLKCIRARSNFCKGSMKKLQDGSFVIIKPHIIHERDGNHIQLFNNFRNVLKRRAAAENTILKIIYDEEARRDMVAASLYTWSTTESIMRLARINSLPRLPANLTSLATLFEDGQLQRFGCCGASFFKGCIQDIDNQTNMIFACTQLIQSVLENNIIEIHVDATFKVIPANMGYQLLTFHCTIQNYSIPIIYVLMENKTRNSYDCVLRFIKHNLLPTMRPEIIVTDYETALRDILVSTFPGAQSVGCWFHHNQAVWKKMKSLNLLQYVNNNENALKSLRLLMCLPLLPARFIEEGFLLVKAFARNHAVTLDNLFGYYQRYWLRSVGPEIVSVYGLPRRTNNNIESFHNTLKIKFSVSHPSLWIFLGNLSQLNQNYHIIVNQLNDNLIPTRHLRVKFLINSHKIKTASVQLDLGLISIWQFLMRCSYASAAYEQRQRNWDLNNDEDAEEINDDEPQIHVPLVPLENIPIIVEHEREVAELPQAAESRSLCMVCMNVALEIDETKYIILPCGHAWVCHTCMVQLTAGNNPVCPICRLNQVSFQRIFFS